MAKTLDQRLAAAKLIKDETIPNANTAPRVGGAMEDINNAWNEELGEINVTTAFPPTSGYHTPETARAAVPESYKRKGRTISYQTAAGTWVKEQYRGDSTAAWTTASNWFPILMAADQNVYNVTTQNPLAAGEYYNPTTARAAVQNQIRKLNLGLKYLSGYKEIDTLTITGPALTDGSISIFLNGVKNTASPVIYAGDTAIDIATKIRLMTWAGWTVGGTPGTAVVTFTRTTYDPVSAPTFSNTAGITANFVRTSTGQSPEWIHEEFIGPSTASWTTATNWRKLSNANDIDSLRSDWSAKEIGLAPVSFGKNKLIDRYVEFNSYINSNGSIQTNIAYKVVKFIPVIPSTQYTLTGDGGVAISVSNTYHQFLDSNLKHIGTITGDTKTFATPSNAYFMNVTESAYTSKYQLEIGPQRTDYEIPDLLSNKFNKSSLVNILGKDNAKAIAQKVVSETIGNTYFKYKGTADLGYSDILFPFKIKIGTIVKNTGAIPLIFASDSSLSFRTDLYPGDKFTASIDYDHVRSAGVIGDYEIITMTQIQSDMIPINSVGINELKDLSVGTTKIVNDSVTEDKTTFFESVNLINKNDVEYKTGYYLNSNHQLTQNATYDTTGYIRVVPFQQYVFSSQTGISIVPRFLEYYDITKAFIPNTYESNPSKLQVPPNGAYYVRLTVYSDQLSQFEKGYEPTAYSAYKKVLPQSLIQQTSEDISVPFFFLPKDVYVAVGRTIEIYYEQVILNAFKWNIQAVCTVGQPLKRKFRVIGDLAHVGNYTLTLRAFNDKGVQAGQKTCTIHIVNDSISSLKKVLPVGDSHTNNKPWLTELTNLNANITRVGTRGDGHEGRSGGACYFYLNTDGTAKYTFEKNYIGIGSNASVFDLTLPYNIGDFVKYKTVSETSYSVFQFKTAHTANTPWNDSEVINISDTNPFWNFNNNTFSYNHYKTFQNINPDCIILWLGTNGINTAPETNMNGALGIKTIIDKIRLEDTDIPIVVVNTIFRGNQNGIGVQSNADGFSTPTSYKFDEDVKVLLLEQALENMIGDISTYPNVYLCPVAATHDSEYNFMNLLTAKQGVNPRITSSDVVYELFPVEATHPQDAGYLQAADEIYSTLCAVFQ